MSIELLYYSLICLQLLFLLPIKDRRSRHGPFPWMTATIVMLNTVIHILVIFVIQAKAPTSIEEVVQHPLYPYWQVPGLILNRAGLGALPALTSTFLHADLSHLLGNMLFLWFFGRKVEDATGPIRFGLFYLLCGFTASLFNTVIQAFTFPANLMIPGLGASGAIAGVMAAYLFLYSEQRILTLVSVRLGLFALSVGGCIIPLPIPIWLPAWVYLVYKFLSDALLGQLALEVAKLGGNLQLGVGVFAHLGGAAGGFLFIYFFLHPEVFAARR